MSLAEAVTLLASTNEALTLLLLGLAAAIEYVFPPFPGDTVTLAGAVLVVTAGLSLPGALAAVLLGGLAGSAADYALGAWLARRQAARSHDPEAVETSRWARNLLEGAERAAKAFARWGDVAVVANRFLPGIRAFIFVAAGMAGLRFGRVMVLAALSSLLWNGLLLAAGLILGRNLDRIAGLATALGQGAWALLAVVAAALAFRWWWRRRASRRPPA